jgi:hypothetical protein
MIRHCLIPANARSMERRAGFQAEQDSVAQKEPVIGEALLYPGERLTASGSLAGRAPDLRYMAGVVTYGLCRHSSVG